VAIKAEPVGPTGVHVVIPVTPVMTQVGVPVGVMVGYDEFVPVTVAVKVIVFPINAVEEFAVTATTGVFLATVEVEEEAVERTEL
jgi:hypothetical protein